SRPNDARPSTRPRGPLRPGPDTSKRVDRPMTTRYLKLRGWDERRRAPLTVLNPVGLDPATMLPPDLHRHAGRVRYVVHVLPRRRYRRKKGGPGDRYVPLKAAYLRRLFPDPRDYKRSRDAIIEAGLLACDNEYRPARPGPKGQLVEGKCYGYRLGPAWGV